MNEIITYEEALRKAQRIKFEEWNTPSINRRLEERIEMMHKTLYDASLRNLEIWCTIYMTKGHTNDTCRLREDKQQEV